MPAIDHLVLPVTTLALARSRLSGLGFTVAPDARHPFGTGNCCVLFKDRTYLEPITILDRDAADMAAAEGVYFVKRLKRFTERHGEGFAMAAMKSDLAEADQARFEAAGVSAGPVFRFARMAAQPDGSETEIGVALAYAEDAGAPDATLFACQHLAPDGLFQPAFLDHANGATGVGAAVGVAEVPAEYDRYRSLAAGETADASGPVAAASAQSLVILTPADYREQFGIEAPEPRRGLILAAIDILVEDLDRAIGFAGPTARRHGDRIVIPPAPGLGATLAFRTQSHG